MIDLNIFLELTGKLNDVGIMKYYLSQYMIILYHSTYAARSALIVICVKSLE